MDRIMSQTSENFGNPLFLCNDPLSTHNVKFSLLCLQEKPLAKSLQRGEDPQFDQVSTVKCNGQRSAVKGDILS